MSAKRDILEIGDLFAFYESEPEIYEILSQSEDVENRIFKTLLKDVPFKNSIVLDVGAGTGRFSILLSSKARLVISLDISKKSLKILKRKAAGKEIEIICGDFNSLPLIGESVDTIVAAWSFNPRFGDAESTFKEMLRVVKKEGRLVIVGNYPEGEYHFITRKFLKDTSKDSEYFNEWMLARGFKRKIVDVIVDLRSQNNIEIVLSGQPPLEMIKKYLQDRKRTWFNLKTSVFYYKKNQQL